MKTCKDCKETKSWDAFRKRKNSPDGHEHSCKECTQQRQYAAVIKKWGSWGARNCFLNYGITIEERDKMLKEQGGCAICGTSISFGHTGTDGAVVDHCHTGGHVRGILCTGCNKALGLVKDSTDTLQSAIKYLNEGKD